MNKRKAFLWHLLFSILLVSLLAIIVYGIWYPSPFSTIVPIIDKFWIVSGVTLLVFPSLTALVYKPNKKSLKMDITVIVLLQLLCFAFGMWVIAQSRPAWVVLYDNKFHIVRPIDLRNEHSQPYSMSLVEQPWGNPTYVSLIQTFTDENKERRINANFFNSSILYPIDYQPLTSHDISMSVWSLDEMYNQTLKQNISSKYSDAIWYIPLLNVREEEVALVVFDIEYNLLGVTLP